MIYPGKALNKTTNRLGNLLFEMKRSSQCPPTSALCLSSMFHREDKICQMTEEAKQITACSKIYNYFKEFYFISSSSVMTIYLSSEITKRHNLGLKEEKWES